jgi:hypothetical protein
MSTLFEDDNGKTSITRVIWAICVLTFMGVWAANSISAGEIQHFQSGDAMFFASLLAVKVGQKAVEAWKEKSNNNKIIQEGE